MRAPALAPSLPALPCPQSRLYFVCILPLYPATAPSLGRSTQPPPSPPQSRHATHESAGPAPHAHASLIKPTNAPCPGNIARKAPRSSLFFCTSPLGSTASPPPLTSPLPVSVPAFCLLSFPLCRTHCHFCFANTTERAPPPPPLCRLPFHATPPIAPFHAVAKQRKATEKEAFETRAVPHSTPLHANLDTCWL